MSIFAEPVKQKTSKRNLIILGIVGLLVVACLVYVFWPKYAFKVDGRVYSHDEVRQLTEYPRSLGVSGGDASGRLLEYLIVEAAAKKASILPAEAMIKEESKKLFPGVSSVDNSRWAQLIAINSLMNQRFADNQTMDEKDLGSIDGYVFVFHFDKYIDTGDVRDNPPLGYGDQARIDADKNYAKQKAQQYRNVLKEGTVDAAQVIKEIKKDVRLAAFGELGFNQSVKISQIDLTSPNNSVSNDIMTYIVNSANEGVGDIQISRLNSVNQDGSEGQKIDAAYFFTKIVNGTKNETIKKQYESAKNDIRNTVTRGL